MDVDLETVGNSVYKFCRGRYTIRIQSKSFLFIYDKLLSYNEVIEVLSLEDNPFNEYYITDDNDKTYAYIKYSDRIIHQGNKKIKVFAVDDIVPTVRVITNLKAKEIVLPALKLMNENYSESIVLSKTNSITKSKLKKNVNKTIDQLDLSDEELENLERLLGVEDENFWRHEFHNWLLQRCTSVSG